MVNSKTPWVTSISTYNGDDGDCFTCLSLKVIRQ